MKKDKEKELSKYQKMSLMIQMKSLKLQYQQAYGCSKSAAYKMMMEDNALRDILGECGYLTV